MSSFIGIKSLFFNKYFINKIQTCPTTVRGDLRLNVSPGSKKKLYNHNLERAVNTIVAGKSDSNLIHLSLLNAGSNNFTFPQGSPYITVIFEGLVKLVSNDSICTSSSSTSSLAIWKCSIETMLPQNYLYTFALSLPVSIL